MSNDTSQNDAIRPGWAAHELVALALTVVLAVWVVARWGAAVQPQKDTARGEERAKKLAELRAADEATLSSFDQLDAGLKRYRIPIQDAMALVVELGGDNLSKEIAERLAPPLDLPLVELPNPDYLADESELDDPDLIAAGKTLFHSPAKTCFNCHQTDPAVPAPGGAPFNAPKFMGSFWGKERLVHNGHNGPLERVVMGPGYFAESVAQTTAGKRVVKGALIPMVAPPVTKEEAKALMAYVRSLSKE